MRDGEDMQLMLTCRMPHFRGVFRFVFFYYNCVFFFLTHARSEFPIRSTVRSGADRTDHGAHMDMHHTVSRVISYCTDCTDPGVQVLNTHMHARSRNTRVVLHLSGNLSSVSRDNVAPHVGGTTTQAA